MTLDFNKNWFHLFFFALAMIGNDVTDLLDPMVLLMWVFSYKIDKSWTTIASFCMCGLGWHVVQRPSKHIDEE